MRKILLLSLLAAGCGTGLDGTPNLPGVPTRVKSLSVDPAVLTLPTGSFHYDPLLTLRDENVQPMWVDLPSEIRALSSNPQVATVNERVRIRTTGRPGSTEIAIHSVADPSVRAVLRLTTVEATIQRVSLEGANHFQLYVGQALSIEASALLSSGDLIPHAQYSSDLDVVTGTEYAAVVDGQGITALQASPPNLPIAIGFLRGGGTAAATLSVREMQLVQAEVRLGDLASSSGDFKIPSGYQARLEILGTFEDGSSRPLQLNQDYRASLSGDAGFSLSAPGLLSQPRANRMATLNLDLPGTAYDVSARVTSVDGSLISGLRAEFENYPDDRRLVHSDQGYAREVRVLADFPGLTGYRASGFDSLSLDSPVAGQGRSPAGWPTLTPTTSSGSGSVQVSLGGASTTLPGVSVHNPQAIAVSALGRRPAARLPIELGSRLSLQTLLDYGDGQRLVRTSDYPPVESPGPVPFFHLLADATTFFLKAAGLRTFQASDAEARTLPARLEVEVKRQSDPDSAGDPHLHSFHHGGVWDGHDAVRLRQAFDHLQLRFRG